MLTTASSPPPTSTTGRRSCVSSAIVAETVRGSHTLKIDGYSRAKATVRNGRFVQSVLFSAGGHDWVISAASTAKDDVLAEFSFSVLDKYGNPAPGYTCTSNGVRVFSTKGYISWATDKFIKIADFEGSPLITADDRVTIRCDVTVIKGFCPQESEVQRKFVVVPPGNLDRHLGDLFENMDGAYVKFEVGEERFSAHRCVLAARSCVFKAELFGAMKARHGDKPIKVEDMEASVFKSLLHFVYTDSLPEMEDDQLEEHAADVVLVQHFLVAADRYNVERLKLMCEERLCEHIDSDMVASSLALAEQHSCHGLKEACFQFLVSPSNLEKMMASDGFEHLKSSCPSVLKELITS
uniref:BTB domain-containing protein n=1 Tax=Oryza punctata TaxID=4537 RepID=A0A0E0JYY4_ORYPU